MPRKIDPRWGEIVPQEPPIFMIEDSEAKALAAFLDVSREEDIASLKAAVEGIGQIYFARRAQDEEGPTRAERNEALRRLAKAEDFVQALDALNHRAESALMDALQLYSDRSWMKGLGVESAFHLIEEVKRASGDVDIDIATGYMRAAVEEYLPHLQRQRGPDYAINLSLAVDDVLDLYHKITGKAPTHSVVSRADNTEALNSKAGRFVTMVFGPINRTLKKNNQPEILPTRIFTEVRRAVERFKSS